MQTESSKSFTDLEISSDGSRVYVTTTDSVLTYNASTLAVEATDLAFSPGLILGSPDGVNLYTLSESNKIDIYDAANGVLSNLRTLTDGYDGVRGLADVDSLAFSDDGTYLFAASSSSDTIAVFLRATAASGDNEVGDLQFVQLLRDTGGLALDSPNALAVGGNVLLVASDEDFSTFEIANDATPTTFNVGFENIEELSLETGGSADLVQQLTAPDVDTMTITTNDGADSVDIRATASVLTVDTGAGDDEVTLAGTTASNATTINAGANDDLIAVNDAHATVTVHGDEDDDTIRVDGSGVDPSFLSVHGDDHNTRDTLLFDTGGAPIHPDEPQGNVAAETRTIAFDADPSNIRVSYTTIESIPGFAPATADVVGPYAIAEGDSLTLIGSGTPSSNASIVSEGWDLNGDNIFSDATGSSPTLTWAELAALGVDDDGTYSVAYRIVDSAGSVAIDTTSLVITNVAPTITITTSPTATSIGAGLPLTVNFSATDPGDDTVSDWTIDWADVGPVETFGSGDTSATHVYNSIGTYDITVTATDEDGDTTVTLATVTVIPVNPTTTSSLNIAEGDDLTIQVDAAGSTSAGVDLDGSVPSDPKTSPDGLVTFTWTELQAAGVNYDGTHNINLLAEYATTLTSTVLLIVTDTAPTATLTVSPSVAAEGGSITATVSGATDVSTADVTAGFEYRFDIDNSGTFAAWSSSATTTFTATQAGTQVVRAQVRVAGDSGEVADLLEGVTITEVAPTLSLVSAPVDGIVDEGQTYTLSLSASDPGADVITEWFVEWGDGETTTVSGAAGSPTHIYADDGSFEIQVTAFDADGIYNATKTVTVSNVVPTLIVNPLQMPVPEASVFSLGLDVSGDPGDDQIIDFVIDWGDGTVETLPGQVITVVVTDATTDPPTTEAVVSPREVVEHVYADNPEDGTYIVSVTARDEDTFVTADATVSVTNVAPTVEVTVGDEGAVEGSTVSLTVNSSDPGKDTVTDVIVNWGDGSSETFDVSSLPQPLPLMATHEYADDGTYSVAVSLVDEDGTHAADTVTMTIANVTPSLLFSGDTSVDEGALYTLDLDAVVDPGTDTVTDVAVRWSATEAFESFGANPPSQVTHTYSDGEIEHVITVHVTDDDGIHQVAGSLTVTVLNVAPTATFGNDGPVLIDAGDSAVSVSFTGVTDPSPDDTVFTYSYDFDNDGTFELTDSSDASVHVPGSFLASAGVLTVRGVVTDKDGGQTAYLTDLTVVGLTDADTAPSTVAEGAVDGTPVGLTASLTAPLGLGSAVTYSLTNDAGGRFAIDAGTGIVTTANSSALDGPATHTITVGVSVGNNTATANFDISVTNVAPTFGALENVALLPPVVGSLSLSGVYAIEFIDPGADVWSGTVSYFDGDVDHTLTVNQTTKTFDLAHTYTADGDYTVTVTLNDDDGGSHSDSFIVTVQLNTPPVANAGGPYTVDEGSNIALDGSGSSDSEDNIVSWDWDLDNDGVYDDATGETTTFSWADDGAYTVGLKVTDSFGESDTDTTTVTVANVAPIPSIVSISDPKVEGTAITVTGSATDPAGTNDTLSYAWTVNKDSVAFDSGTGTSFSFT
ncbi:MAG: PKD domain-containing protein, partial [Actinomycetia bacterium]|nr:PKD domain-containing protein [Actinomycetes bacterium]